jgi:putative FmdB family regulatory protein
MPIYSYKCGDCSTIFDLLVGLTADEQTPKCVNCGSNNLEKLLTPFGVKCSDSNGSCTAPS